jgi:RNA-directed DNA polymerase
MGSLELQASSGLAMRTWHRINWVAGYRRVQSLPRRIVQAVQAGVWRKGKRLSSRLVHSCAARALAVKRVTEHTGKKTPGGDGDLWDTPTQKAQAVARIGRWLGYRPAPVPRIYSPKKDGKQRPLSIPTLTARARQAGYLQALQPIAETTGDQHSCGVRPKRQGAEAIDQCLKVLRQNTSATWILAGDLQGGFDNSRVSWIDAHLPMNKRVLSRWLRSGFLDRGTLFPPMAGVPQGGIISPVVSNMVLDGLETVVHGGSWHRRVHNSNYGRWADAFIVTATARQVLDDMVLPRINAFLAERGVRLSPTKTVITPIAQGLDFLGQTLRKPERPHGKPGKLRITPSQASFPALNARSKALCKRTAGCPPGQRIDTLNPGLRGWAHDHRHVICGETLAKLDDFVWRRLYRWAKRRHPHKTGRWIAERYVPHQAGEAWRFADPVTGKRISRVREAVNPQRHVKGKGAANPCDPAWAAYFQHRDRQLARKASSALRAKVLHQQHGRCPVCRQVSQREEDLELHHRAGAHQHNRLVNLAFLHPTCHRQVPHTPDRNTDLPRSSRSVGQA